MPRQRSIDNILIGIGIGAFIVGMIDLAGNLGLPLEGLSIVMLIIFIYELDPPRLALGRKLPAISLVPFIAIAAVAYESYVHHLPNTVYVIELIAIYPIAMYFLDRYTNPQNMSSRLGRTYHAIFRNEKRVNPKYGKGHVKLLHGLKVVPDTKLSKLLALSKLSSPLYFGVFALALVIAGFDDKIPANGILSTSLALLVAILRVKSYYSKKNRKKGFGKIWAILEDADTVQTSIAKSVVRKFMTPMGLGYTFLLLSSIIFMFTASSVLTSAAIKVWTSEGTYTIFQKIVFPPLLIVALFPFVALPFIAAAFAILPKKKLRLMKFWFVWPAYCIFILVLVKGLYQP